jgi:hypothetical protein
VIRYNYVEKINTVFTMVANFEITKLKVNPNFQITFKRLLELTELEPDLDDDDELLNPSDYAVSVSIELLTQLYQALGQLFPLGFSNLESRGGINLIWTNQKFDKEVRIKVPVLPTLAGSLYYRKDNESELINNPSLDQVYQSLLWLSTDKVIY